MRRHASPRAIGSGFLSFRYSSATRQTPLRTTASQVDQADADPSCLAPVESAGAGWPATASWRRVPFATVCAAPRPWRRAFVPMAARSSTLIDDPSEPRGRVSSHAGSSRRALCSVETIGGPIAPIFRGHDARLSPRDWVDRGECMRTADWTRIRSRAALSAEQNPAAWCAVPCKT